jgi:hypothetical protein
VGAGSRRALRKRSKRPASKRVAAGARMTNSSRYPRLAEQRLILVNAQRRLDCHRCPSANGWDGTGQRRTTWPRKTPKCQATRLSARKSRRSPSILRRCVGEHQIERVQDKASDAVTAVETAVRRDPVTALGIALGLGLLLGIAIRR